jgi:hypothetical protein
MGGERSDEREFGGIQVRLDNLEKMIDAERAMMIGNVQPRLRAVEADLQKAAGKSAMLISIISSVIACAAIALAWFK